jgi:hypothetical protein
MAGGGPTLTVAGEEVEEVKLASPLYAATMESTPLGSDAVANVALPDAPRAAEPRVAPPLVKVTEPVGVPAGPATCAVKDTLDPSGAVVTPAAIDVVEAALAIVRTPGVIAGV